MNHITKTLFAPAHRTTLKEGGRVVIPADYRKVLGLAVGDDMIVRLKDGEIHIYSARQAIERAQRMVAKYDKKKNKSMVDELIADRRREAKRELE